MAKVVTLTNKVKLKLESVSKSNNVGEEALANTILMLALCNDELVKMAVHLINAWGFGGVARLEKRDL